MARRNDLDICAEILQVARAGAKKTQIVYQANLNFKIVEKYLKRLTDGGLLQSKGKFYFTTPKGVSFLEQFRILVEPISEVEADEREMIV